MELMKKAYPDNDPVDLLRFLRARNLDIKDSREMYDNYLKWRSPSSKQPPCTITHADAEEQLSYNRFFLVTMMGDVQKDKVPLVYIVCRNHFPKYSTKKTIHFGVFLADILVKITSAAVQVDCIIDMNDIAMKNVDIKFIKKGIAVYQDYFPERLRRAYVVGLPPAFHWVWEIVEKLLDERTKQRLLVLKENELGRLVKDFSPDLVPEELGGTWKPNHTFLKELGEEHWPKPKQ